MKRIGLILIAILLTASPLFSQIIHIPADQPSIQAGIDVAEEGDTVLVADSTYYENINFKGRAITVASHFILDRDTSHISKTIIDGSQPTQSDTASTILMISGEDSTSVLCGFTITGGRGTLITDLPVIPMNTPLKMGGGVLIIDGGCTVENNIIKDNTIGPGYPSYIAGGAGVHVNISKSERSFGKSVVIRHNSIQYNKLFGNRSGGAGMHIYVENAAGNKTTNISIQNNSITHNSSVETVANSYSVGVGICMGFNLPVRNGNYVISNNIISHNRIEHSGTSSAHGGGIYVYYLGNGENSNPSPLIYNNIITDNYAYRGGGISTYYWNKPSIFITNLRPLIYNNSIANNTSSEGPGLDLTSTKPLLFNNIFWDNLSNPNQQEFRLDASEIVSFNNNIQGLAITDNGNLSADPLFEGDSFSLAEGSPCIGNGIDSIAISDEWYYAPTSDIFGQQRPHQIDTRIDIGAIESSFAIDNTGIDAFTPSGITIYPNPTNNFQTIEFEISNQYSINIASLNGQLLINETMEGNTHQIDLSSFQKGLYFITIRSKDFVTTRKIIKL